MPKYFVYQKHSQANHAAVSQAWVESSRATDAFKGQMSYCSCPTGQHEVFAIVDAASADEAKKVAPMDVQGELTVSEVVGVPI